MRLKPVYKNWKQLEINKITRDYDWKENKFLLKLSWLQNFEKLKMNKLTYT